MKTISDLLNAWRKHQTARAGFAASTHKSINSRCNRLIELVGRTSLRRADKTTIDVILASGGKYSNRYRLAKSLQWAMQWAVDEGLRKKTPYGKMRLREPKYDDGKISFTVDEVRQWRRCPIEDLRLSNIRDLFLLQCFNGYGWAELESLNEAHVYVSDVYEWIKIPRKKTPTISLVPLYAESAEIFRRHDYKFWLPRDDKEYNELLQIVQRMVGITDKMVTSKVGRKTFAQHWYDRGLSLEKIGDMMGNSPEVLEKHYVTKNERGLVNELKSLGY